MDNSDSKRRDRRFSLVHRISVWTNQKNDVDTTSSYDSTNGINKQNAEQKKVNDKAKIKAKNMKSYIVIDPKTVLNLEQHQQAVEQSRNKEVYKSLKEAKYADECNSERFRLLENKLRRTRQELEQEPDLVPSVEFKQIIGPPINNYDAVKTYNERNKLENTRVYQNCMMYLTMKGQAHMIFDTTILDIRKYFNVVPSQVITPDKVISMAKSIALRDKENIDEYICKEENIIRYIYGIRQISESVHTSSMTRVSTSVEITPPTTPLSSAYSHLNSQLSYPMSQSLPTSVYRHLPNTISQSSFSGRPRSAWDSDSKI